MKVKEKATSEVNNAENPVEESIVPAPKETEAPKTSAKQAKKAGDVSDDVDKALKMFNQYDELYIGGHGEIYTKDTPESIRQDAVLYTNKYYQS